MKAVFTEAIEQARETLDPRFATKRGDRFGVFRFKSPSTGATLRCIVGSAELHEEVNVGGEGWDHVSISKIDKVPTWEEMCFVKELFFADDECVVQFHPPKSDYINHHPNVLNLWKPSKTPIPMPPKICV